MNMKIISELLNLVSSIISVVYQNKAIGKLDNNKNIKLNFKNITIIIISSFVVVAYLHINDVLIRCILSFLLLFSSSLLLFGGTLSKRFLYLLVSYILLAGAEILVAPIAISLVDLSSIESNGIIKLIFSTITMILVYSICKVKIINNLINKIIDKVNKIKYILSLMILILMFLFIVGIKNYNNINIKAFFYNFFIFSTFIIILWFGIYNYFKANKEVEKTEALLNFITKYEKIIEKDRINRHEILNNLLILKSMEIDTQEYKQLLDDLIKTYSNNKNTIKNIHKLPSGLKGILYYKLYGLEEDGFTINVNISNKLEKNLKTLNNKEFIILCKVVNIALDNAIEAASVCKDKILNVDIYSDNKKYMISIENTFKNKIDINKIDKKYYSTKGKNRGLGLYIVKSLLNENHNIKFEQKIENKFFITNIYVNKKTIK